MPSMPTLVLVPGAWQGPWAWRGVVEELSDLDVRTVELPSVGPDPAALGDLHADAAAVRSAVRQVGGPVLVCGHGYGAAPVSEGVAGLADVVGLVFLSGLSLDIGESVLAACGGEPPSWWDVHEAEGYVDPRRPAQVLYTDADAATSRGAVDRLGHQSLAAFEQCLTRAAWRTVPSTYVVCERDAAIPVHAQESLAERAGRVLRMATAHSPFLSRPAQLAGVLRAELALAPAPATR
ncbi:alpha/beta fold hydrolase [Pseudonocardia sichuanensis]